MIFNFALTFFGSPSDCLSEYFLFSGPPANYGKNHATPFPVTTPPPCLTYITPLKWLIQVLFKSQHLTFAFQLKKIFFRHPLQIDI